MRQYEQIVEDLMTILAADVDPTEEAIRDVDARYAEVVNAVNDRLVECDKLLHKGHRTESIQKCETEPNLLDVVAILDFPEAGQWGEYVRQFGLPEPPQLRTELAIDLNEAYSTEASSADILRQHRLLALARAPLGARLKVLRQVAKSDPGSPVWQQDVRSWEQVRHDQLPKEIEAAVARSDAKLLTLLEQEVRAKDWLDPPPKALVDRVTEATKQARLKHGRRQLEALEKELTEAYANFDVIRAKQVRQRWNAQVATGIERNDDPLLALVTPAFAWLDEQERQDREEREYAAALSDLEGALDAGAPRETLERLEHAVLRFDRGGLPEILDQRLRERYASLDLGARRKSRLIVVSVVLAALLATAGTTWAIVAYNHKRELATVTTNLKQLKQDKKFKEASSYLDELKPKSPRIHSTPEVQMLLKEIQAEWEQEKKRRAHFERALADARRYGKTEEGHGTAVDALVAAKKLADNEAEQNEVANAQREVDDAQKGLQEKRNQAFAADLNAYGERVRKLDTSASDSDTLLTTVEMLLADGGVLAKRPKVPSDVRSQVQPLLEQLKSLYEKTAKGRSEADLLRRINDTLGDRSRYLQSLETYVRAFPTKSRATDFKRVFENETTLWDGVESWNELIGIWSQRDFRITAAAEAPKLIAEAEALLKQHPGFPAAENLRKIIPFLAAIKQRVGEDGAQITGQLAADLQIPALVELRMLKTREGKRYYFKDKPPRLNSARSWVLNYFTDFNFEETLRKEIPDSSVSNAPTAGATGESWTSPQRDFSEFAANKLAELTDTSWESTFFQMIKRLSDDPDLEPVLKVQLLSRVTQVACQGSQPMQEAFSKYLELIQKASLNNAANWVDPEDSDGQRARTAAAGLLKRMEAPDVAVLRAQQIWKTVVKPRLGPQYVWKGWLCRDENQWKFTLPPGAATQSGELFVVQRSSSESPEFIKIGDLVNGTPTLRLAATGAAVEGRPVFLVLGK
ncbi:MAG: hypothetical protein NTY19_03415 [Planctomycetota bacterium]|nr:hypothetical protein [Planctomycetota bacterium]